MGLKRSAIIAVGGPRAHGLADAYGHIRRAQLVAVSTRRHDKLEAFGDKYGVDSRYTDYREMLANEKPDLVHVNTPPSVRLEILAEAEAAGVAAVLVEKPVALQGEDFLAIRDFAKTAQMKIAVNHQLHFHPRRLQLQNLVRDGAIGEVRFIEASSGMSLAYQGTHILQAIGAFIPGATPVRVFAQVSGANGLVETPKHHYAPDHCLASINYDNGVSAILRGGEIAPRVIDGPINKHKRITVYGSQGHVHWNMHGWETVVGNTRASGEHSYAEEDLLGQAATTEAMIDWLDDDRAIHPLNIDTALREFNIVLGFYQSGLAHAIVRLSEDPPPDLLARLRERLG